MFISKTLSLISCLNSASLIIIALAPTYFFTLLYPCVDEFICALTVTKFLLLIIFSQYFSTKSDVHNLL